MCFSLLVGACTTSAELKRRRPHLPLRDGPHWHTKSRHVTLREEEEDKQQLKYSVPGRLLLWLHMCWGFSETILSLTDPLMIRSNRLTQYAHRDFLCIVKEFRRQIADATWKSKNTPGRNNNHQLAMSEFWLCVFGVHITEHLTVRLTMWCTWALPAPCGLSQMDEPVIWVYIFSTFWEMRTKSRTRPLHTRSLLLPTG